MAIIMVTSAMHQPRGFMRPEQDQGYSISAHANRATPQQFRELTTQTTGMAHMLRAGSKVSAPMRLGQRSLLGTGALAAAGIATLSQRQVIGFGWVMPRAAWGTTQLFRYQSTLSGLFSSISSISDNMAALTPPVLPPSWTHSAEDVLRITKGLIAKDRELNDKIAALPAEECNFESVCIHLVV